MKSLAGPLESRQILQTLKTLAGDTAAGEELKDEEEPKEVKVRDGSPLTSQRSEEKFAVSRKSARKSTSFLELLKEENQRMAGGK